MLLGREYTRLSDKFLEQDKEYTAQVHLGIATDTYDCEGQQQSTSQLIPTLQDIQCALKKFQGDIEQVPPMFSAKKINGQKLYHLARKGKTIERPPCKVNVSTEILSYAYPFLEMHIKCSKGTYIRSLAHDLGAALGCGAHLSNLIRTRSGQFYLNQCLDGEALFSGNVHLADFILKDERANFG